MPPDSVADQKRAPVYRPIIFWARATDRFPCPGFADRFMDLNVEGRLPRGVLEWFWSLWQKSYELRIHDLDVSPQELVVEFKGNFSRLEALFNRFCAGPAGLEPGAVCGDPLLIPRRTHGHGSDRTVCRPLSFSLTTSEGRPRQDG